jgi:hypothetical protein
MTKNAYVLFKFTNLIAKSLLLVEKQMWVAPQETCAPDDWPHPQICHPLTPPKLLKSSPLTSSD